MTIWHVRDRFNRPNSSNISNGWTVTQTGSSNVSISNNTLVCADIISGNVAYVSKTISASPSKVVIKFKTDSLGAGNYATFAILNGSDEIVSLGFGGGYGATINVNGTNIGSISTNTYYTVVFDTFDWGKCTFNVGINGSTMHAENFNTKQSSADTIRIGGTSTSHTNTMTVDYIEVSSEETGTVGTRHVDKDYPVTEGLISGTTKQTGKPNLEEQTWVG